MRRRILALLFFPAAVFLWMIGWCLYYTASKPTQTQKPKITTDTKDDSIEILAILPEEETVLLDS